MITSKICYLILVLMSVTVAENRRSGKRGYSDNDNRRSTRGYNPDTYDMSRQHRPVIDTPVDSLLPRQSFDLLVHNRDKQTKRKKDKRKDKKNSLDIISESPVMPDTIVGPPGPAGPPGPPGAVVNVDTLMQLFNKRVDDEANRRAEQILAARCPGCKHIRNETLGLLEAGELDLLPHVKAGFFQTLSTYVSLPKKSRLELAPFNQPSASGSFDRGNSFQSEKGRFYAPLTAVYNVIVSLHIKAKGYRAQKPRSLRRSEIVKVMVCIQLACEDTTSLVFISGLESNAATFTINLSGMLFLKENEFTSIFVENNYRRTINILPGSSFQGVLIGT